MTGFAVNVVVLLFVLYFMLLGGRRMEEYIRELLPFSRGVGSDALHEVRMIVRSNAIGIPLLAVVQGGVALAGYLLFGVPDPLFWGVLTCLATIIPVVGTALVWVPLALWLGLGGHAGAAVGLAAYGVAVVTQSDNVVRLVLQRRMADIHPLITVFGVVIGLSLFGFMGGDLRAAAAVDACLLRACLQAALPRPPSGHRYAIGRGFIFPPLRAGRRRPSALSLFPCPLSDAFRSSVCCFDRNITPTTPSLLRKGGPK